MTLEREPPLEGEVVNDEVYDDAEGRESLEAQLLRAGPMLARLAAGAWWKATRWGVARSVQTGGRLARAAADPARSAQILDELGRELRGQARDLLGITELDERVAELMPPAKGSENGTGSDQEELRVRGARLLRRAARLEPEDRAHPAYARILTELAPDEARILRLLATKGSQPAVDVRAANLIGVGSALVAGGMNMIGAQAGCQHRDRVPAYLNNLERLGLVWFSREPVGDPEAYQVLEAQPEVLEAMRRVSRAKTIQRSIHLTPFGEDFCAVCLQLDTAEAEALAGPEE
ncbi:MAG TPA: Abi-alpha family protein [Solirubrobacteraceae bacterium]|nr:Abi-alpha family protein [Solirubrobacteraceae bacterium]